MAAKKASAKKSGAKKSGAKKSGARKGGARKPSAKKSAAKRAKKGATRRGSGRKPSPSRAAAVGATVRHGFERLKATATDLVHDVRERLGGDHRPTPAPAETMETAEAVELRDEASGGEVPPPTDYRSA
jgi:hypothetical protein